MKDIEIRDLRIEDLDQPFYKTLSELAECKVTNSKAKDIFYERESCGIRTIVVIVDEQVVGTGSIILEPKFIHSGNYVAHIEDVAVDNVYQKIGLGRMIIEELIRIAKEAECYKVILNCDPDVVSFYEKLGFKKFEHQMRLDI